jgi:RNA polymerase sigma-70 factor (ECF subfamily)
MTIMEQALRHRFGALYERHSGWLRRWLDRRLDCRHTAADLSHDAFLRLFSGADPAELREPRAYLLVIANRLLINWHRRRQVEQEALRQVAVLLADREQRSPEQITTARNLLAEVALLLVEELPEKPRRAFFMAKIDGLSYREIAQRLDVSESSVKQYLAKALAHCHARLHGITGD